jgi:hypothetical protein
MAYYRQSGESMSRLRKRGRLAQELVSSQHSQAKYACISFIELENALDERAVIEMITDRVFEMN